MKNSLENEICRGVRLVEHGGLGSKYSQSMRYCGPGSRESVPSQITICSSRVAAPENESRRFTADKT